MAHYTRLRADGAWIIGGIVPEFATIDTNLATIVNGDGGGTWSPTNTITVGGAGMWLAGSVCPCAGLTISTSLFGINARIYHGDNDHVVLFPGHTGQTRTIATSMDAAQFTSFNFDFSPNTGGIISISATGASAVLPLRVHNRATLASVTFSLTVGSSHGPPATLPAFRVYSQDVNGVKTPLLTNGTYGYATFTPTPASATAWFAAGAVQTFVYTCNSGVIIDTSQFTYFAEVLDESGAGAAAGNSYLDATCSFTGIADLSPQ